MATHIKAEPRTVALLGNGICVHVHPVHSLEITPLSMSLKRDTSVLSQTAKQRGYTPSCCYFSLRAIILFFLSYAIMIRCVYVIKCVCFNVDEFVQP